jgi:antitoxin (DNA-binding transcriptional repressor) of toxin-antitoxin stability system
LVNQICFTMTTVSIRDLRTSFPKVEAMLNAGEEVWVSKRGRPFARIVLDTPVSDNKPDFAARFGMDAKVQPIVTASGRPLSDFLKWRDAER